VKGTARYEFVKGAVKAGFTEAGGYFTWETSSRSLFICESESATGEYDLDSGVIKGVQDVVITAKGCEMPIFARCQNRGGLESGEIVTNPLQGQLGYISGAKTESPVVGQELTPEKAKGAVVEFECADGAVKIKVAEGPRRLGDCIIATLSGVNVMSATSKEEYTGSAGVQSPLHFQTTPTRTCNFEASTNGAGFERQDWELATTITNEEPLEIKA
jgi:hypothetical protein